MYSTYHNVLEKNQMMTPPTIGLTSSIVNDKLSNITLEDNSSGLFAMNEDKSAIQTKDGVPLEASQFKITSSNTEINGDDTNAVNKSYCDSNYVKNGITSLTLNQIKITASNTEINSDDTNVVNKSYCDSNYIKNIDSLTLNEISTTSITLTDPNGNGTIEVTPLVANNASGTPEIATGVEVNDGNVFMNGRAYFKNPISIHPNKSIIFNSDFRGAVGTDDQPQGQLTNLIPSTITTEQMSALKTASLLDNVCPTYKYCEKTYVKKGESGSSGSSLTNPGWQTFSVYTTDGNDLKTQLTNVSMKIGGSHITIPIPTTINSTILIMSVNFTVRSTNKTALNALGCTLNSLPGSITSQAETDTRASVFSGYTTKGTCIRTTSPYEYKFSLICPFCTMIHEKAYLHFFFDDNTNYTASNEVYILATKTEPQVNVTIFGI